jgi:glycogen operon protein
MYAAAPRYSLRRQPGATINFVTCHDGFTLCDLVSSNSKHNQANVTDPGSGTDDNRSWNCGSGPGDDGPTTDPAIAMLRRRQQRNLLATLLLSRGVPMLQGGDERNRTQLGNNNAWCLDGPISWMDWSADPAADALTSFVRALTSLRAAVGALRAPRFPDPGAGDPSEPVADTGLRWFNPDGAPLTGGDWDNSFGHSFAVLFPGAAPAPSAVALFNAYWGEVTFVLPNPPSGSWTIKVDTTTEDGAPTLKGPLAAGASIAVGPRSVVVATT